MDAAVLNRRFVGAQEKVAFRSAFAWQPVGLFPHEKLTCGVE
jgi:hypothetical protein